MNKLTKAEFKKIVDEIGYGKAGDGDSYYTQEFLDSMRNDAKSKVGKRIIK
jgi:hypothetical protein